MFKRAESEPHLAPALPTGLGAAPFPAESHLLRWTYILLALAFSIGFFQATHAFWAPAHAGVDQNGYLVGGRQFAQTLSMGLTPPDPFGFVGRMWIGTESQTYYPKYPLGLPFIYAALIWIGGVARGVVWAHLVSPVAMSLAVLGTFFLLRTTLPSFHAILGAMILATGPVTLQLTNNPNSHAATLFCVVWGMVLLLRWWKTGGLWTARGAGLLIGYAATIRYTEGLLLLPLLLVIVFRLRGHSPDPAATPIPSRRPWREALVLLSWWALPIFLLLTFNRYWFGDWTGYDSTNESTGFRLEYFLDNIETVIRQLHMTALFFTLPLALLGLIFMFARQARLALVLAAWIVPCILLYTAYYWAPDGTNTTGYMRFFLTVVPALILPAMWLLHTTLGAAHLGPRTAAGVVAALAALAIASLAWTGSHYAMLHRDWAPPAAHLAALIAGPALLAAVIAWVVQRHTRLIASDAMRAVAITTPALVALFACATQLYNALPPLESSYRTESSLHAAGRRIQDAAPTGAIVFGSDGPLHHLQFIADYRLYTTSAFSAAQVKRLGTIDPSEPSGLQPQRAAFVYELLKDQTDAQLIARQLGIIQRAIGRDTPVFFLGNRSTIDSWRRQIDQAQRRNKNQPLSEAEQQNLLTRSVLRSSQAEKTLQVQIVDRWSDAPVVHDQSAFTRRPRGPAARRMPGRPGVTPEWVLLQVTAKPPPPATQPTR